MIRRALATVVLVLGLLVAGIYIGGHPGGLPGFIRDPLVGNQDTRAFDDALDTVARTYYRKVPRQELADSAIHGMVASLHDPYSRYFDPKEYAQFQHQQAQQFSGVGVAVGHDRRGLRILEVYADSPAKRAGLRHGDLIVAAGGKSLEGRTQAESVALVKGPDGSPVTLRVARDGTARTVSLVRQEVTIPSVDSILRTYHGRRYAVIRISSFTQDDVDAQLRAAIERTGHRGARGIILDLRGNPGGLVTQAQLVASEFITKGKIVTTKGRSVPTHTLDATGSPAAPKIPLVVLVDRNSASAAEIVAGALQDHHRATLVGTRTYGKGVFQQLIMMPNGGALDLTAGQYFTPNGRNLGGGGTKPGSGLKPNVRAVDDPRTPRRDEALDVALRTLAAKAQ